MDIIFEGIVLGLMLGLVFGFGPAFFTLLQTSINRGFKKALFFDLGVLFNDMLIVVMMLLTPLKVDLSEPGMKVWAGIVAGVIAIGFGVYTYFSKPSNTQKRKKKTIESVIEVEDRIQEITGQQEKILKPTDYPWYNYAFRGFALNIFNPFVWAFWVATVATANGVYIRMRYRFIFFAAIFATTLCIDLLKIFGSTQLQRFFNEERLIILNKVTGVIIGICGIVLIVRVLI